MKTKNVWFDARNLSDEKKILPLIHDLYIEYLLIEYSMYDQITAPHRMKLIVAVHDEDEIESLPEDVMLFIDDQKLLQAAKNCENETVFYQFIDSYDSMDSAWQTGKDVDILAVELKDTTNIPIELLIARLQSHNARIFKCVQTLEDAKIAYGVMEAGCDGVLLKTEDISEIMSFNELLSQSKQEKLELAKGVVVAVEHMGMGFRACIDTTNLMSENEGMIIGSTSGGGLVVSSETHFLPYMELRPFRVNAGAVHSYIWTPNGMTNYLTELKAGSRVLCVDTDGNSRQVTVGRVKLEARPLLKIEVDVNGHRINTIVQDDWHIRIFGFNREPMNASTIKIGDELLTYTCAGGRHVGVKIDESLEEK